MDEPNLSALDEKQKQAILVDQLKNCYEGFVGEYVLTDVSIVGAFDMFVDSLKAQWRIEAAEEDGDPNDRR